MSKYHETIPPRRFDFSSQNEIPKYWHSNGIGATFYYNITLLVASPLERRAVASLKTVRNQVNNHTLRQKINSFIAQEAIHANQFTKLSKDYIESHFNISERKFGMRYLNGIIYLAYRLSPHSHLAFTAAGEHITAVWAMSFLTCPMEANKMPNCLSALFRWHSIEELEHRSVSFDTLRYFKIGYAFRSFAFIVMTGAFCIENFRAVYLMLKIDNKQWLLKPYWETFKSMFAKNGFLRPLVGTYFSFLKPSYHPSQLPADKLISSWQRYFKEGHPLEEQLASLVKPNPPGAKQGLH